MTEVITTPSEDKNQPEITEPVDNLGNPINEDGTPREVKSKEPEEGKPTYEDLEKALKDTKAELTKKQQGLKDDEEKAADDGNLEIEKKAEEKGVDFSKYSQEYNDDGGLSEDSYKELEAKGYDKQLVDDYIAGQLARVNQQTTEVAAVVGGIEKFDALKGWAAENLSEKEIAAFNAAVVKDTESAKLAVQGLNARYVQDNGQTPTLIGGDTANTSGDVFKSPHEMTKAMEDPKYWSDPDYQKEVAAKVARSMKAGKV